MKSSITLLCGTKGSFIGALKEEGRLHFFSKLISNILSICNLDIEYFINETDFKDR